MTDEVEQYIRERRSMVLATMVDGEVRTSTAGFAVGENMQLYFFVFAGSIKHRGVQQHSRVSLVIDDGFRVPMRGVEILGEAKVVTGAERRHGEKLLSERFTDLQAVWNDPRILIVRVTPERIRYTDWTYAVGQSRETIV
jgi:general stress protein 26